MAQKNHEDLEFIPPSEIIGETGATARTVIKVYLPGFKIGELKVTHVQGCEPQQIRIAGKRPREGNIWIWFTTEFPIPPDCDAAACKSPMKRRSRKRVDKNNSQKDKQKLVIIMIKSQPMAQDTNNKKAEEPAAPKVKGKVGISEEEPKLEESRGQTSTTSQASAKVVAYPETREEESSEAVRGGSTSDPPPPKPRESNKKAEEQEGGEPVNQQEKGEAVTKEVPKPEEPTSHAQQAKQPNEVNGAKSETTTDDNQKEEGDAKNAVKRKGYECTFAETKLR
ncbi:hypothetical protein DM860_009937 [Cuscuta australis]|uniref:SHSP domain-containing protein n=1 Tax=Cuscuta australis TaxID=267555 RepID=A0A328DBL0_9ASTE|nr:hypothetical protein DM860_009937 [Cuscuta australis]